MRKISFIFLTVVFICISLCGAEENRGGGNMRLSSPEFENNTLMPKRFTCQGEDVNPMLMIDDAPEGAKSLVLIVDDPDASMGTWGHWVVFDIPVISVIEEDSIPGKQGKNDFGINDYRGPCPPSGTHRYFFRLYALDSELNLKEGARRRDLEKQMDGHILGEAELTGLYKKD